MPKPKPGEPKARFMPRCIAALREEGKPQAQCVAECSSMYDQMMKKGETEENCKECGTVLEDGKCKKCG